MQSFYHFTQKSSSLSLQKLGVKLSSISFAIVLSAVGFFATGNAYAADQSAQSIQKVAANDNMLATNQHEHRAKSHQVNASTDKKSGDNSQLGGYSRQDGAMQGAYGDGEYAE